MSSEDEEGEYNVEEDSEDEEVSDSDGNEDGRKQSYKVDLKLLAEGDDDMVEDLELSDQE
ncbi:hypothetical protein Z043_118993 [Scleropages formosus]|nr:hypothetical protein Z043_118993 [Scleropages formosus]